MSKTKRSRQDKTSSGKSPRLEARRYCFNCEKRKLWRGGKEIQRDGFRIFVCGDCFDAALWQLFGRGIQQLLNEDCYSRRKGLNDEA